MIEEFMIYFEKYHKQIINENPQKEFKKFIENAENKVINREFDINEVQLLNDIFELIGNRINFRNNEIYNNLINSGFNSNIKGINTLKRIYSNYNNSLSKSNNYSLVDLHYIKFILEIIFGSTYPTLTFVKTKELMDYIEKEFELKDNKNRYYRGQSNSKWNLIPSSIRGLNNGETFTYNYDYMIKQYNSIGVLDLYMNIINPSVDEIEITSFLQHAISFSPLIDFTSNIVVALFFALSNFKNVTNFYNEDSSLFILFDSNHDMEKLEDQHIKNLKIGCYKSGVRSAVDYQNIFSEFGKLTGAGADTYIHKTKSNDRMKYQSGLFILFDNYILNDTFSDVIYNARNINSILKVIIDKSIKKDLLDLLKTKYPDYNPKYLMNPYSRFEEV